MIFGEESLRPAFRNRLNLFFFGTLNNMDFSRNFSIDTGIAVACFLSVSLQRSDNNTDTIKLIV